VHGMTRADDLLGSHPIDMRAHVFYDPVTLPIRYVCAGCA
jgi:hypothetical protein